MAQSIGPENLDLSSLLACQKEILVELIGNTRMEFGWYVKDMLDTIISTILETIMLEEKPLKKDKVLLARGGHWSLLQEAMADTQQFEAVLRHCEIAKAFPHLESSC